MKIQVVNKSNNPLPVYETAQSAGMDLRAEFQRSFNLDMNTQWEEADNGEIASITLKPLERMLIPTGLYIALPVGYEAQIRPRSGLAIKYGITVLNTPGTIDSDYRGEVCVILVNLSNEDFVINQGDRIAQMVIAKHEQAEWENVEVLDNTDRGTMGFGHTGR